MSEGKWQPIETAPKDGTVIRVWTGEYQCDAWFGNDDFSKDEEPQWFTGDGDGWSAGYYYTPCEPIKWMPLPDPPKE